MKANVQSHPSYIESTPPGERTFAAATLRVSRRILFLLMLFFRIPLRMISNLTVTPLMLGAVAWGLIAGWTSTATLMLAGASFGMFIVSYLYDTLLLLIAPEPIYLSM